MATRLIFHTFKHKNPKALLLTAVHLHSKTEINFTNKRILFKYGTAQELLIGLYLLSTKFLNLCTIFCTSTGTAKLNVVHTQQSQGLWYKWLHAYVHQHAHFSPIPIYLVTAWLGNPSASGQLAPAATFSSLMQISNEKNPQLWTIRWKYVKNGHLNLTNPHYTL